MKRFDRRYARYLSILGLSVTAAEQDIQAAYRAQVMAFPPDVNRSADAPSRFREAVEAYGALMEELRSRETASGERIIARVKQDPAAMDLSLSELERRMVYSASPQVRASAAAAAGLKGGPAARKLLLRGLGDDEECVRNVSVRMLTRKGEARDIPALLASAARNRDLRSCRAAGCILWKAIKRVPGTVATRGGRIPGGILRAACREPLTGATQHPKVNG